MTSANQLPQPDSDSPASGDYALFRADSEVKTGLTGVGQTATGLVRDLMKLQRAMTDGNTEVPQPEQSEGEEENGSKDKDEDTMELEASERQRREGVSTELWLVIGVGSRRRCSRQEIGGEMR